MSQRKHPHYFKSVAHLAEVDVYRVLDLFGVTDQALGHAVKKLLVAGGRGVKDQRKDIQEAVDTLQRRLEMMDEDNASRSGPATAAGLAALVHADDSEGWIPWDDNGIKIKGIRPVEGDVIVMPKLRNGSVMRPRRACDADWIHTGEGGDIVAYKVVF